MGMETIFCDFCKSKRYKIFLNNLKSPEFNERFTLVKCSKCDLVYLNPRPKRNEIAKYYLTTDYFSDSSKAIREYSFLYDMVFSRMEKGSVLDIGAGTGLFLTEFKRRAWEVNGVEPSPVARKIAKKKFGIDLKKDDVLDIDFKNKTFDLVVLNNVIEHLYKPKSTLKKAFGIIKDEGFVLISCPNISGIGPALFGQKWYGMDVPRHLYQFSPESLSKLLCSSGFKIVQISHSFYRHNYLVLFESFRRFLSPRFSNTNRSEKHSDQPVVVRGKSNQSLVKQVGVFASKVLSGLIAVVEPLIGRGEIITILAIKS